LEENINLKGLSAVAVRVIGWLVILEGIKSAFSSVLLWLMREMVMEVAVPNSTHPSPSSSLLSVITPIIIGLIELVVGFFIIQNSEFLGRILCKGLDERL
jgi:hypothetical protein